MTPAELADASDGFGMLRRCIPRRIGGGEGIKARVLVRRGGRGASRGGVGGSNDWEQGERRGLPACFHPD